MNRRQLLGLSTGLLLVSGCGLLPGQTRRVPRIGFVVPTPLDAGTSANRDAFVAGLGDYGYTQGQNIEIEWHFASSQTGPDLPAQMADLVALQVDIIVTSGSLATQTAQHATTVIPIVGVYVADPVGIGLVESLARPGGNVTALSAQNPELDAKRLQILRQTAPGLARVGFVYNLGNPANVANWTQIQQAAALQTIVALPIELHRFDDLEPGLEHATGDAAGAVITAIPGPGIPISALAGSPGVYDELAQFAIRHQLPTMGFERNFPESGGLMSYGVDPRALFRRAGYYVDRILKGTGPAELPVEQPTTFELVVNRTTVQALGITLPQEVELQVTDWVQ